jgi:hypothetical protein
VNGDNLTETATDRRTRIPGPDTLGRDGCACCGPEAVVEMVTGLCEKAGVPCQDAKAIPWVSSQNTIILIPGAGLHGAQGVHRREAERPRRNEHRDPHRFHQALTTSRLGQRPVGEPVHQRRGVRDRAGLVVLQRE